MNVVNVLLIVGAILMWIWSMACLSDLHSSDAAGNGLALAFGVFASIGLWIALLILLLFSALKGGWPTWTKWAGFVLVPACAAANFSAIALLHVGRVSIAMIFAIIDAGEMGICQGP